MISSQKVLWEFLVPEPCAVGYSFRRAVRRSGVGGGGGGRPEVQAHHRWPTGRDVLSQPEPAARRGGGSCGGRAGGHQWPLSGGQAQPHFGHQLITPSKAHLDRGPSFPLGKALLCHSFALCYSTVGPLGSMR